MKCYAEDVIKIALGEVGYLEKASNKDLDSKTGNAGNKNFTKYARDLDAIPGFYNGKKNGYAWCDIFVDWCFVQAFGVEKAKELLCHGTSGAGCYYSMNYYKNKGQLHSSPKVGDQIFFQNSSGSITHTGLVYDIDNNYVYTVEGNTSSAAGVVANGGSVRQKKYSLSYKLIAGYGRPAYDEPEVAYYKPTVLEWQKAAIADGFKFPRYGADGVWGAECEAVAKQAVVKKRLVHKYKNLTKLVQKVVGVEADGKCGAKTVAAIKTYQIDHGLVADGCVGPNTWKVILNIK